MEINDKQRNILVGKGGHAKAIFAKLREQSQFVVAVVDNQYPAWLAPHRGIDQRPIHFQTEEDRLKFLKNEPDLNKIMGTREIPPVQSTGTLCYIKSYIDTSYF